MTGPIKINNLKIANSIINNIATTSTANNFMMSSSYLNLIYHEKE